MKNERAQSVGTHPMAPTGANHSLPTASTQQFRDKKNTLPSPGPFCFEQQRKATGFCMMQFGFHSPPGRKGKQNDFKFPNLGKINIYI